ncbi:MAG: 16S rRNA (adenine(1518)-N(6)/adenine(1519)-N(6))-dimethyltransferase RsmA [Chloroflexi bacterium]|nr:16S rRNA (adenine(1518)-N(6)/adenine(1519)-N(6))-dimethyltransferase RsmA [Chloroflexota bacterium]MCY3587468.1 16S rRNA (adenine(1518)-N(6)/adenine(1519)-N(6))-dimethyltransferase RsmA [Chloroflexota bacterium]MCY3685498.1 16S rRNA (adenine(1518)-N(6)/adenine(1519)-N(6))-dimethyltransferase RsmA [Chloroflexota bacterium]MDE2708400.1 16S rRNA (adenine(1518)-N(6)/adenine(1519)-N(6))-dimethyltransferase RsmA [Chloroflexota bacterium]
MSARRRRARLGQHLLRDERVLERIIEAVPQQPDPILEVGAGDGALTARLAELSRPLVSIELDEAMAFRARRRLAAQGLERSAAVVEQDVLETDPREALALVAAQPPYGLVGNLPYAITAPIFRKFLEEEDEQPAWMLAMIQHEVAQRITANPGKLSLMAVSVQFYAEAEMLFSVEREAFDPPPQVRSAVVMLRVRDRPAVDVPSVERFFEVVRGGFRSPRKQLHNALSQGVWLPPNGAIEWLEACEIDPARRPGTLTLEEWARLAWWREEHLETYSEQAR